MSYDDTPFYERETFLKNRLDALLKPIVGKLSGKNAPQIKLNDIQSRFFRFDLRQELPGRELQQFSSVDMDRIDGTQQEQERAMLNFYGMKPIAGPITEPLQYYSSDISQDKFMAIARIGGYRLIVFIHHEHALLGFRRKYDFAGAMLPQMLMPPLPEPPNNLEIFKMNTRVLR